MTNASLLINQGTNAAINFDANNGTNTQVVAVGYGTVSTVGTLPNLPGGTLNNLASGTINAATVILNSGTINVGTFVASGGTIQAATVSSLPNLPGGTLTNLTSGTINAATAVLNSGTINVATAVIPSGTINVSTISSLPNIPGGTLNVLAAGTINAATVVLNNGTINVGTFAQLSGTQNVGTVNTGTINTGTFVMPSGTLTVLPNLPQGSINVTSGTVSTGTINTGTINVATISAGTVHLAGSVLDNFTGLGTFTITLGTLASSGSVGRQSTLVDNSSALWPAALIGVQLTPGTVTAVGAVNIYLIRSDNGGGPIQDDLTGASDALATVNNAPLLGVIPINIGTNSQYKAVYDTSFLGHLGPKFGVVVQHALGNPFHATAGSHSITYQSIMPKFT